MCKYLSANIEHWKSWVENLKQANKRLEEFLLQSAYIESLIKLYAETQFELSTGGFENKNNLVLVLKNKLRRYQLGELIIVLKDARLVSEEEAKILVNYKNKRNNIVHDLFTEVNNKNFAKEVAEVLKFGEKIISIKRFSILIKSFISKETKIINPTYSAFRDKHLTKNIVISINSREEKMLELYLQGRTYEKIGEEFSISPERVRQILGRAGAKIHKIRFGVSEKKLSRPLKLRVEEIENNSASIISEIAERFGTSKDEIVGRSKKGFIVVPRHIIYYLLKEKVGLSSPAIGKLLRRDHTTVLYGHKKIQNLIATSKITL